MSEKSLPQLILTQLRSSLGLKLDFIPEFMEWLKEIPIMQTLGKYISRRQSMLLCLVLWHLTGGRTIYRNGRLVLYAPSWFYDLCVFLFFPVNTMLTWQSWCIRPFPSSVLHDWSLDPNLSASKSKSWLEEKALDDLKDRAINQPRSGFKEKELIALFDTLTSPTQEQMLGHWKGKIIRSKGWLDWVSWCFSVYNIFGLQWGKRYRSPYVGDPLVFNFFDRFFFPVPIWGNVSIPMTGYREGVDVTMTYDNQPWHDHFRVLKADENGVPLKLLGFWATREKIAGWFTLEALPKINAAVSHIHRLNGPDTY